MSTTEIPNSLDQIRQGNHGDVSGELWGTFNIDLSTSPGKAKVSKRMSPTMSDVKMDNDRVMAMAIYKGYVVAWGTNNRRQYIAANRNLRLSGNWTSSSPIGTGAGDETDMVVFDGKLLISRNTNIQSLTAADGSIDDDWWTAVVSGTALTNAKPHTLDVSITGAETLFVTDSNLVRYYNTDAGHSTVTLPSTHTACTLTTNYQATWAGTYTNSGKARVYEIRVGETLDGTPVAHDSFEVDGTAVLSLETIDGVVYAVTDWGHIQAFNGTGFVTVASFPFAHDGVTLAGMSLGDISDLNSERAIHPKGMKKYNKSLLININTNNQLIIDLAANPTDNDDIFENVVVNERSPSGIWEYNTETGVLNHRYSFNDATTENGTHRHLYSGPILVVDNQYTRLLASAVITDGKTEIFAEDPANAPFGYIITKEIDSDTVQDAWERLYAKTNTLIDGESVEIKYRTTKNRDYPKYSEANWTGGTTFVVTNDVSMVEVGDEVEVLDGYGAGKLAHVTEIDSSTTTNTITVDTSIGSNGETNNVRFQNWKKAEVVSAGDITHTGLGSSTTWVQFKIVFNGFIEMRGLINKGNAKNTV